MLAAVLGAQEGPAEWLAELRKNTDDADPALIVKLADSGQRAAAEGLSSMFEPMRTVYMRREIVRALGRFANVDGAEQPAFERLVDVAGNSDVPELREAAVEGLARSSGLGKHFLRRLVESDVPDDVRLQAMAAHVRHATAEDDPWYEFLWNLERERRKDADGKVLPREAHAIRELAFGALAQRLSEGQLIETLKREDDPKIRRKALEVMHERDLPQAKAMAEWLLERVDFPGVDRAVGARILMARDQDAAVKVFFKLAKKRDVTTEDLREEMARLLAEQGDDATGKKVARLVGKGKPHEKVFALRASVRSDDPKVVQAVRKQLADKDGAVRRAAAMALAVRRDKESVPALEAMIAQPKEPGDVAAAIDAITLISPTPKWFGQLKELAVSPDRDARNAALAALGGARRSEFLPVLVTALAHPDWSTRFVAIDGFVQLRHKDGVPALIARLGAESGRLRRAVGDALWTLTGEPHDEDPARWSLWWQEAAKDFEVISKSDLEEREKERELRRLKQRTVSVAKFFGIKLVSHRVIFVIDSSGSMLESVEGRYEDQRGAPRIDVAKRELKQCIENLQADALFNVYAFSSGIEKWQKEGIGANTAQARAAALEWIERLGASGGTNLYDSLEMAFQDPDVDTIFVLSDGEPSVGKVIDPHGIRTEVAEWNKHRKIEIHTIAIGGNLEVLEWLAQDSGGKHVQIR